MVKIRSPREVLTGRRRASRGTASGLPAPESPWGAWRQRLPTGDDTRALSRLHVVRDAGKQPAQLDGGRQLPLLLECGADCGGFRFGDDEHPHSMMTRAVTGTRCLHGRRVRRIALIASAVGGPARVIDLRGMALACQTDNQSKHRLSPSSRS